MPATDGYHGDNARTVGVGTVPEESAALARVCLESIEKAIEVVGPGVNYHDLATTIFDRAHDMIQTPRVSSLLSSSLLVSFPACGIACLFGASDRATAEQSGIVGVPT